MVKEMLIADLYCGAGGAAWGIHLACEKAGVPHRIVGFDTKPMPRYPFEFVQQDALTVNLSPFDAVWASPPCQNYSPLRWLPQGKPAWDSVPPTRKLLMSARKPYVLENVMGARLQGGWLCGRMFGLPFERHRAFETSFDWLQPGHPRHYLGHSVLLRYRPTGKAFPLSLHDGEVYWSAYRKGMGIDWMKRAELTQAIPPVYAEYIWGCLIATCLNGRR